MTRSAGVNPSLDPDVADCLRGVIDPEVGLSVVDLGLVYEASRDADGIAVAITLTTQACPLGEMIVEDARERLAIRFPDEPRIHVDLIWHPPWTPDRISDHGLAMLGRQKKDAA
jgi:metal-sulfur cluster biosynthetic enzyme